MIDRYEDPTRSNSFLHTVWPRRNWAMRKLLNQSSQPAPLKLRRFIEPALFGLSLIILPIISTYAVLIGIVLIYGVVDYLGNALL